MSFCFGHIFVFFFSSDSKKNLGWSHKFVEVNIFFYNSPKYKNSGMIQLLEVSIMLTFLNKPAAQAGDADPSPLKLNQ